ncbi:MAG TPA: ABC transporter substrate-binding protein [Myxococcus sp.]|nr:ABC transporter substrate-binding protein [Myxococcus sp.]
MVRSRLFHLHLLVALLVATSLLLLPGCVREAPEPLRVGTVLWPGHEPLFLARQLGYLDERKVRLVEYSSLTEEVRAFRNGAVQAVGVTLDMALQLEQHGFHPKVVLVLDASMGGDAVVARPELRTLGDLRGRRVAVEDSGVSLFVLSRALEHAGLKPTDLDVVHLPVDEHMRALQERQVDAVVTFEPYASRLLEEGARRLFDSTQIPGEVLDVLVTTGETTARNPEALRHLSQAWFKALAYLEAHPDEALSRMSPRLQTTDAELARSMKGMRLIGLEENRALLGGPTPGLLKAAATVQRLLLEMGILPRRVELEALPTPEALEGSGE